MEKLLKRVLEGHVISYLSYDDTSYLVAIIKKEDYGKDDSRQEHFTGKTFNDVLGDIVSFLNEC